MYSDTISTPDRAPDLGERCRDVCAQWRHAYLLLAAVFWVIWRAASLAIPQLDSIRVMGGLHPFDVLLLLRFLQLAWLPPLLALLAYLASFASKRINSSAAVAVSAVASAALLALVVILSLVRFSMS